LAILSLASVRRRHLPLLVYLLYAPGARTSGCRNGWRTAGGALVIVKHREISNGWWPYGTAFVRSVVKNREENAIIAAEGWARRWPLR